MKTAKSAEEARVDLFASAKDAVANGNDLDLEFPCGTTIFIPAASLKQWNETEASGELILAMTPILAAAGVPTFKAKGTILDLLLSLLSNPAVMQLILTMLSGSIVPK